MNDLIIFCAKYLYVFVVLGALVFLYLNGSSAWGSLLRWLFVAAPVALLLTIVSSHFISSPRPFVVDHVTPLFPHPPDNGFPSDHTIVTMIAAMMVFPFNRRLGGVLGLLAVVVGSSRVLAGVHHPIDIVGSIIIAALSMSLAWVLVGKGQKGAAASTNG